MQVDDRIGAYRVERLLGSTTTGALYQAIHLMLPRRAVIKVMHTSVAGLQPFAMQLLREACLLDALDHPGIPNIFESGLLPDRRPWFAAEKIDGVTLVERIVAGQLHAIEVAAIMRDVAEILEYAHRRGVVHRCLRPDRIVITRDRRFPVAIPDWSDARTHDATTRVAHVPTPGSRHYVAPELARGDNIDDRADVYALGVAMYQALTGKLPRESIVDDTPHIPVRVRRADVPGELSNMIDQMLASDRFDRPSAAEVRADLDFLLAVFDPVIELAIEDLDVDQSGNMLSVTDSVDPSTLRIRRPKWTPPYTDVRMVPGAAVSGEITTTPKRRS